MKSKVFLSLILCVFLIIGCKNEDDFAIPQVVEEPCEQFECLNNGLFNLAECRCDCPDGWGGINCGTELNPSKIRITNIRLNGFKDVCEDYDNGDFPNADVGIIFMYGSDTLYTTHVFDYIENTACTPCDFDTTIDIPGGIVINNPTAPKFGRITIKERDIPPFGIGNIEYEEIDSYPFAPFYENGSGFPEEIIQTGSAFWLSCINPAGFSYTGAINVIFTVEYEW